MGGNGIQFEKNPSQFDSICVRNTKDIVFEILALKSKILFS